MGGHNTAAILVALSAIAFSALDHPAHQQATTSM
jgi:hypothetical protein